jgi:arsenate reductase
LRDELGVELDERDYARTPLSPEELAQIFKGRDPRDFLNPKSPAFKAKGLAGKTLTAEQALKLIAEDPRLMKRPLTIAGNRIVAGFDRDELRKSLS